MTASGAPGRGESFEVVPFEVVPFEVVLFEVVPFRAASWDDASVTRRIE